MTGIGPKLPAIMIKVTVHLAVAKAADKKQLAGARVYMRGALNSHSAPHLTIADCSFSVLNLR